MATIYYKALKKIQARNSQVKEWWAWKGERRSLRDIHEVEYTELGGFR